MRQAYRELGLEVEAWMPRPSDHMRPANVAAIIEKIGSKRETGHLTVEPGAGSIEFVGKHSASRRKAASNVVQLRDSLVHRGYTVLNRMDSPFPTTQFDPQNMKPRYRALWDAARLEVENLSGGKSKQWKRLGMMNNRAATHVHFSFDGHKIALDGVDDRIVVAVETLKAVAPRLAKILCRKYKVVNTGHPGIWHFWCDPNRTTQFGDWCGTFEQKRDTFEKLTRFMKCVGGDKETGKWMLDLETPLLWNDEDNHGSGAWHFVRERPTLGTFEVRMLPSWPVEHLEAVLIDIDRFVRYIVSIAEEAVGMLSYAEMRESAYWEKVCTFPIGGVECIPLDYSFTEWCDDCYR